MDLNEETKSVLDYCIENLDLEMANISDEYFYASMPLCVIDSIYSIGVRYEGVINTIYRFCQYFNIEQKASVIRTIPSIDEQVSTTDFLKLFADLTPTYLASEIFKNRQRTSTHNGILKAEAVVRFLRVLKDFNAEYDQDIPRLIENQSFEFCVKAIPGQKSGISLKYFFMLAGTDDYIKPDRMIIRFLQNATGKKFNLVQCQEILYNVASELSKGGYKLTPKSLDNIIWNFQREN